MTDKANTCRLLQITDDAVGRRPHAESSTLATTPISTPPRYTPVRWNSAAASMPAISCRQSLQHGAEPARRRLVGRTPRRRRCGYVNNMGAGDAAQFFGVAEGVIDMKAQYGYRRRRRQAHHRCRMDEESAGRLDQGARDPDRLARARSRLRRSGARVRSPKSPTFMSAVPTYFGGASLRDEERRRHAGHRCSSEPEQLALLPLSGLREGDSAAQHDLGPIMSRARRASRASQRRARDRVVCGVDRAGGDGADRTGDDSPVGVGAVDRGQSRDEAERLSGADLGTEAALAWWKPLIGTAALDNDNPGQGYFSDWGTADPSRIKGDPTQYDWDASPNVLVDGQRRHGQRGALLHRAAVHGCQREHECGGPAVRADAADRRQRQERDLRRLPQVVPAAADDGALPGVEPSQGSAQQPSATSR